MEIRSVVLEMLHAYRRTDDRSDANLRRRVTNEDKNKNRFTAYKVEEFRTVNDSAMSKQMYWELEPLAYTLMTMHLTDCPN
jgi:hypothetical protein